MLLLPFLISCGSGTAAVQTGLTPTPFAQPTPVPTTALSLPTPTISTGEIAGTTPGKGDDVFLPPPTPTPYWDVSWPLNAIEQAQAITITMGDVPEIQLPLSTGARQRLLDAIDGQVEIDQESRLHYPPYPDYRLLLGSASEISSIIWWQTNYFVLHRRPTNDEHLGPGLARYAQANQALWKLVAQLAPRPPHYVPDDIRHLLHAEEVRITSRVGSQDITYEALPLTVARSLIPGKPAGKRTLEGEPMLVVLFTVEGVEREVRVWMNDFTYGGRTYELESVYTRINTSQP